jgi:hypothetical protein
MLRIEFVINKFKKYVYFFDAQNQKLIVNLDFQSLYQNILNNEDVVNLLEVANCLESLYVEIYDNIKNELIYESTDSELLGRYLSRSDITKFAECFDDKMDNQINIHINSNIHIDNLYEIDHVYLNFKLHWDTLPNTVQNCEIYYLRGFKDIKFTYVQTKKKKLNVVANIIPEPIKKLVEKDGSAKWISDDFWEDTNLFTVEQITDCPYYVLQHECLIFDNKIEKWVEQISPEKYSLIDQLINKYNVAIQYQDSHSESHGGYIVLNWGALNPHKFQNNNSIYKSIIAKQRERYQQILMEFTFDKQADDFIVNDIKWKDIENLIT